MERAGRQARHPALEQERRDAPVLLRAVDRGEHQEVVGEVGEADPDLLAVEHVAVAVAARGGREVGGVGAHAGLGQPERRQLLAPRLGHQPALPLLLGPPLEQRQAVEPDVDALDDPERGVGPLELLAQQGEADVVHARAAVALRDRRAQEPELAHLREHLGVRLAAARPTRGCGAGSRPRRRRGRPSRTRRCSSVRVKSITASVALGLRTRAASYRRAGPRCALPILGPWTRPTDSRHRHRGRPRPRGALAAPTCRPSSAATWTAAGPTASATGCSTRRAASTSTSRTASPSPRWATPIPRVTAAVHAQVDRLHGPGPRDGLRRVDRDPGPDARRHVPGPARLGAVPQLGLGDHRRGAQARPAGHRAGPGSSRSGARSTAGRSAPRA